MVLKKKKGQKKQEVGTTKEKKKEKKKKNPENSDIVTCFKFNTLGFFTESCHQNTSNRSANVSLIVHETALTKSRLDTTPVLHCGQADTHNRSSSSVQRVCQKHQYNRNKELCVWLLRG